MWSAEALKNMYHSVGRRPAKARLVMLQVSLESLGASLFVLMVVGDCCRIAWRMVWVMMVGMSESGC